MSVADSVGDLAVSVEELRAVPAPPFARSRMATFASWFALGRPTFERALAVLRDVGDQPVPPEALEALQLAARDNTMLTDLMEHASTAFEYIGYEEGHRYGGAAWSELCLWRSAAEVFRQLGVTFDLRDTDEGLAQWGHALFEPLDVPAGVPRSHWWWFSSSPPEADQRDETEPRIG